MNPSNVNKKPSHTRMEKETSEEKSLHTHETNTDKTSRNKVRRSRFLIEFIRSRMYLSKEKLQLRKKVRDQRNSIKKIKAAERKRRIIGKKILDQ